MSKVSILGKVGCVLCVCLSLQTAFAATLNVPGSYSTIIEAVNAANTGDEIVVAAGTYEETDIVTFKNPNVTLTGSGTVVHHGPSASDSLVFVNPGVTGIVINNIKFERLTADNDWMRCVALHGASSATMNNCIFTGPANGVGVIVFYGASVSLLDCTFSNFNPVSSWAAGVFLEGHDDTSPKSNVIIEGCTFDTGCNGWIKTYNGPNWVKIGEVTVRKSTFKASNNPHAIEFIDGGNLAIQYDNTKDLLFEDCSFEGTLLEVAEFHYTNGGGPKSLTFTRCNFKAYNGLRRMFWLDLPCPIKFDNCLFGGGQNEAIMWIWGGPPSVDFYHCTFITDGILGATSSTGTDQSTFIYGWDGGRTFNVTNCLFHCPVNYTPGFVGDSGSSANRNYNVSYSIIDHPTPVGDYAQITAGPGYSNVSLASAFINPGARDYHITESGPWANGGTDLGYSLDLDGNPRVRGGAPDMGAYESAYAPSGVDHWSLY